MLMMLVVLATHAGTPSHKALDILDDLKALAVVSSNCLNTDIINSDWDNSETADAAGWDDHQSSSCFRGGSERKRKCRE